MIDGGHNAIDDVGSNDDELACSVVATSFEAQAAVNLDDEAATVHKSKVFLPMNSSNPKEEFSDAEGTDCIREGRSKAIGLKEKLAIGFSIGITLGFFKSSNRARVLSRSSH